MHPILFYLGGHPIYTYGFFGGLSIILGAVLGLRRFEQEGYDGAFYLKSIIVAIIGSFFMGKLLHVVTNWPWYQMKWSRLWDLSTGHVFYGGYIGSILFPFFYSRWAKQPFLPVLDATATYMPLGLALHRTFACMMAGCCHGRPTDLPWGIVYPADALATQTYGPVPVHPTQLYESTWALGMFAVLIFYRRYYRKVPGELIALQIALYSLGRFFIEFFRGDTDRGAFGGLSTSQWISIILAACVAFACIYLRRERKKAVLGAA